LSLAYDYENDYLFIDVYTTFDSYSTAYFMIVISYDPSEYPYCATYSYNGNNNMTIGSINAITLTNSTSLTYTYFEGSEGIESEMIYLHQSHMVYLINWFDDFLDLQYFNIGIKISDMGFLAWNS
jgi:hypothetical protein